MRNPLWIAFTLARLAAAFFLIWAWRPHPYSYFESLRLGVMAVCALGAYSAIQWKRQGWAWVFGFVALLINPFAKIALGRQTWNYVDVLIAILMLVSIPLLRSSKTTP